MPRYKLTIAYDGTAFCGWQKQEPFAESEQGSVDRDQGAAIVQSLSIGAQDAAPPPPMPQPRKLLEVLAVRDGEDRARVALRTVQHVVERAVREIVREPVVLMGASRTDAGVHSRGQVAAFSCSGSDEVTEKRSDEVTGSRTSADSATSSLRTGGWPVSRGVEKLVRAINGRLPEDVVVTAAEVAPDTFDPIGDCTAKGYSYTVHIGQTRPLWDRSYAMQIWDSLDVARMREASVRLVGEHDFASFAAAGHGRLTTVRTIFECRVTEECGVMMARNSGTAAPRALDADSPRSFAVPDARRVRIEVSGNGFLYNMVRIIAGTLVEVGRGRLAPEAIAKIIAAKNRRAAGPTLPARGLCLEWVRY